MASFDTAKISSIDRTKGRIGLSMRNGLESVGTYPYDISTLRVGMSVLIGKVDGSHVILNQVENVPRGGTSFSVRRPVVVPPTPPPAPFSCSFTAPWLLWYGPNGKALVQEDAMYSMAISGSPWVMWVKKTTNGYDWSDQSGYPLFQPDDPNDAVMEMGVTVYEGKIYAGGGSDSNSTYWPLNWYQYNTETQVWTRKADILHPLRNFVCEAVGGKVYMGIGENWDSQGTRWIPSYYNYDLSWNVYDIVTDLWSELSPFPGAGQGGAVSFVLNGNIYVTHGSIYTLVGGRSTYVYNPNIYKYVVSTDTWSLVGILPFEVSPYALYIWPTSAIVDSNYLFVNAAIDGKYYAYDGNVWRDATVVEGTEHPF
mgnify:CR=1 FL=1